MGKLFESQENQFQKLRDRWQSYLDEREEVSQ